MTQLHPLGLASLALGMCLVASTDLAMAQGVSQSFGRELGRIPLGGDAQSIAWSPDQKRIVVVVESGLHERRRITSVDVERRTVDWSIDGQDTFRGKAAFLPGGSQIVTRLLAPQRADGPNWNLALSILEATTGRIVRQIPVDLPKASFGHRARDFALSEDGMSIAVLTSSSWVIGLDTRTWQSSWKVGPLRNQAGKEVFGKKLVLDTTRNRVSVAIAALQGGDIQTWSLSDGRQLSRFIPYDSGLSLMAENFVRGSLITGGDGILHSYYSSGFEGVEDDPDTLVRAWDPLSGRRLATFLGPGRNVQGLALSPDGRYVVASKSRDISPAPRARDAFVLMWEQTTAKLVVASNFRQGFPRAVAFSPDGRQLALEANQQLLIFKLDPALLQ